MLRFHLILILFAFVNVHGYSIDNHDEYYSERFGKIVNPIDTSGTGHGNVDKGKFSTLQTKIEQSKHTLKSEEKHHDSHHEHGCDPKNCVPYHLCSINNTIIKDGSGLLDSRFNPEEICHYLEVCCEPEKKLKESIIPPIIDHYHSGDHHYGGSDHTIHQGHDIYKDKHSNTYSDKHDEKHSDKHDHYDEHHDYKCGYRYKHGMGFQIKEYAHEAQYGEFPWMAAILIQSKSYSEHKMEFVCGGSIIHPKVILTAAHCIYNVVVNHIKVRGGEWDTQTTHEHYPLQDRYVKEVFIHDQFYKDTLQYDIALLFLKEPFHLTGNVRTICLPPKYHAFETAVCYASGWGKDVYGKEGKYSVILKKRKLPIITHKQCEHLLRETRLGHHFELHKTFICAGGEKDKDMCKGDGGSPLVCPIVGCEEDRYYQSGIVAWGIGCNDEKVPGVYVNVSLFRDWIDKVFKTNDFDTKYYTYYK